MIQVYARADAAGRVEELGSSVFLKDPSGWTLIDEGEGDRYAHAQGNYLDKPLTEEDGTHNYCMTAVPSGGYQRGKGAGESGLPPAGTEPGGTAGSAGGGAAIAGRRAFGGERMTNIERAKQLRLAIQFQAGGAAGRTGGAGSRRVSPVECGGRLRSGRRVRYADLLYKCLTGHTAQESWAPGCVAVPVGAHRRPSGGMAPVAAAAGERGRLRIGGEGQPQRETLDIRCGGQRMGAGGVRLDGGGVNGQLHHAGGA